MTLSSPCPLYCRGQVKVPLPVIHLAPSAGQKKLQQAGDTYCHPSIHYVTSFTRGLLVPMS